MRRVRALRREAHRPRTPQRFLASGNYLWNAGIFVFRGSTLLDLVAAPQPELSRGLEAIAAAPDRLRELYARLPADSIDYAIMEKLDGIATLPLDCGWSDLGSWEALDEILPKDIQGNTSHGDTLAVDARGNLLFADQGTVAVLGVEDLVVVRTGDAVLVMPKVALAGGPQAGRRARRPRPQGPAVIQPATISTAGRRPRPRHSLGAAARSTSWCPGSEGDWEVEIGFGKGRYLLRRCQEDAGPPLPRHRGGGGVLTACSSTAPAATA